MGFLSNFDGQTIALIAGVVMLIGSFATMRSPNASKFDQDFAFFLLIAGVLCIGFGFGIIEPSQFQDMLPGSAENIVTV